MKNLNNIRINLENKIKVLEQEELNAPDFNLFSTDKNELKKAQITMDIHEKKITLMKELQNL